MNQVEHEEHDRKSALSLMYVFIFLVKFDQVTEWPPIEE